MKKFFQWLLIAVLTTAMACALLTAWNPYYAMKYWWLVFIIIGYLAWEEFFKDKS